MKRSFLLYASIVVFFLAGSSAPTPLYSVYQRAWGFSSATVTAVFAIYALAVLAALLVVGSLSDFVGRRPVLLAATVLQAVSMGVFIGAHGVGALIAARVVQGLATGAAVGAAGAGVIDVDRDRGTLVTGFAPMLGTGAGSVVSGLCVEFLPAPTKLVYLVLAVVFVAQTIGVAAMPESASRIPGALASLRPRLHVPERMRRPVLLAVPALVGAWALAGFYGSLGPTLVRRLMASNSPAVGGLRSSCSRAEVWLPWSCRAGALPSERCSSGQPRWPAVSRSRSMRLVRPRWSSSSSGRRLLVRALAAASRARFARSSGSRLLTSVRASSRCSSSSPTWPWGFPQSPRVSWWSTWAASLRPRRTAGWP